MPPFERRWISPKQAAEYLDLSAASIYRLCQEKKLPAARIGHSLRIDIQALDKELERQVKRQM
jgi:excisionase family DNA binding protein